MSTPAVRLRILTEAELLPEAELSRLSTEAPPPGLRAGLQAAPAGDFERARLRLAERTSGPARPSAPALWGSNRTDVCRVADTWWLPRFGALIGVDGAAPRAPVGGVLTAPNAFATAPGVSRTDEGFAFTSPDDVPELGGAGVFMPWGGGFNYGHFLLDALPSLLALAESGLAGELAPAAPPLRRWQRDLLALLDVGPVREVAAPVVRLRQAAYATSMDHFLHAPNALLLRMRERVAARAGPPPRRAERIYLSRRSHAHPMRVLLNEVELERALVERGFLIVRPERLPPAGQVALARDARVIVGPTGAAMANALFAAAGALVVDIQPEVFPGAWTPAFGELVGHDWQVYCAPAPAPEAEVPWVRRIRRGFRFAYRLPLPDFLAFLDARL